MINMTQGQKIKALRMKAELTQEELGKILGIKKNAVCKYEKDLVINIPRKSLDIMSKLFGVPISDLLDDATDIEVDLANETHIFELVQGRFGKQAAILLNYVSGLNSEGQIKLTKYAEDIIDKYQK